MPKLKTTIIIFFITASLFAQNFSNGFNFNMPWNDSTSQKFLPHFRIEPITDNAFIKIDANANFSRDGNRIRFWGVNSVADGACPDKTLAGSIAGRIRKMGINLVRFHHIDSTWPVYSLFAGQNTTRQLNSVSLDRLEYFISKLKENGIYINMNLNVGREVRQNDGIPDWKAIRDSCSDFAKTVTLFDPYLIMLQKEFAQQLLTHVNPYTGRSLAEDPVMAMLETNNENSLYRAWRDGQLKPADRGGKILHRHSVYLDSLWNDYLLNKYASTDELKNVWNYGSAASGRNEQIINGGFELNNMRAWGLEQHNGAVADTSRDGSVSYRGNKSVKVDVKTPTGTEWHVQFKQPTLTLQKDSAYTVSFAVKSDGIHQINVSAMNEQSPWNGYGGKNITVNSSWQTYTFSFTASENNYGHGRLTFQLGKEKAVYWIDEVSVTNAGVSGVLPDESIEEKNITRIDYADCVSFSDKRVEDMSEFYIALQRKYFTGMNDYLKNTLGVKVPIVNLNWNIGPADLSTADVSDYVDNHSYWDHPQFPGLPWSSTDWLINNTPMVKDANGGTITGLFAGVPSAAKPFTISEYNHAYPNIYQSESLIFITGYSSFHNTDGIMYFDYNGSLNWDEDFVDRYFDIHRNPVYMSLFPSCALAFRNGFVSQSKDPVEINYSAETLNLLPKDDSRDWWGIYLFERKLALRHSVRVKSYNALSSSDFEALEKPAGNIFVSDNDEITLNTSDGTLAVETEKYIGMTGYLSRLKNKKVGSLSLIDSKDEDFGTMTWVTISGEPLNISDRSLITIASKVQNTGMVWNSNYTSLNNNWGNKTVTSIYPLSLKLDLNIYADSIKIYPLVSTGKEGTIAPFTLKPFTKNHFLAVFDQNIYRTTWFGIEKFGKGDPTDVETSKTIPSEYKLEQNFPNPFNPATKIKFSVPSVKNQSSTPLQIKIFDILGKEVSTLVNEEKPPGNYEVNFDGSGLSSGIYFYTMQTADFIQSRKMILLK